MSTGDKVIDATVGNGHDTIKLAQLVGPTGHVYGFDIQQSAIEETQQKLLLTGLTEQVTLFQQGHETIHTSVDEKSIQAVIFNLGYLPKSDKSIITLPETTLAAIEQSLNILTPGGIITIMVYYGHAGGEDEKNAVEHYLETLSQDSYAILKYGFINQVNTPPFLIAIEKKK
ncbi:tRNA (mnm(5)s(2)U34)-methyltransferase [Marinilactibacillus kalidii]|uniref:tRNA (mnm(5)s(2)U34)-methyltransferase n=1 Tax=Marinilactibacillus kalidii TaxID=2820274 RepID=UPI0031343119